TQAIFHRVLAVYPSSDVAWCNLSVDARLHGQRDESLAFAQQAVHYDPRSAPNFIALGGALRDLDRHAEAEAAFRKASELEPGNVHAVASYVMELGYAGRMDQAETLARMAIERWPD